MARLDIRKLKQAKSVSFVVEMQSELLADIDTVVVAPIVPVRALPPIAEVNPIVTLGDKEHAVRLEQLISVPRRLLGEKVGSLLAEEYRLMRALDRLLSRT
jgi:toxin CcdB